MIEQERFRAILGSFPSGVTIVTALDEDGEPRGFTCSSVCSVSLDPPLILICVDKRSETLPAMQSSGAFVVNFLAAGNDELSQRFASKQPGKFEGIRWRASGAAGGAPVLEDAVVAHAECRVTQAIESGDHWVFIGELLDGMADEEQVPLLYHRRQYRAWPQVQPVSMGSREVKVRHRRTA